MDISLMNSFSGITDMQALQSIQSGSGVTNSTGNFFDNFIQSLMTSFDGTNAEAANLIAGLNVFSEENPEENDELMNLIASMMAMGVNYNDVMSSGSFDPSSYINSALNGNTDYTNYFDASTYSDLLALSTNTGTDMSTLMDIATGDTFSDGQLLMELAMNSANTNALNSSSAFGTSTSDSDFGSFFGSMYTTSNSDLATELYSANSNMSAAIAQAMATTDESTIAQVSTNEEPTEPTILEDIASFPQYISSNTESIKEVESTQQTAFVEELDVEDLNNQIATGIKNGEITDEREMVIRLRPEGLGEVTVKLVQDADSNVKIDIVTASQATADLLNDKLPQLRESMRELQAEISDVLYHDNEGNAEQNAKDQQAQWAYNQEQRNQRQAMELDELEDLTNIAIDDDILDSKLYI